ncbi:MAG: hypothetical protein ABIL62_05430 [Planctomycetota bacterium]
MNKNRRHKQFCASGSNKSSQKHTAINRREFLAAASSTVAAFTIVPRRVMGDMGNYSFYQIFKILRLPSPVSVEAGRSQYWEIVDNLIRRKYRKGWEL